MSEPRITPIIPKEMLCPKCLAEGTRTTLSEPQGEDREMECPIHGKLYFYGAWRVEPEKGVK